MDMEAFDRDGYAVLRDVVDPALIAALVGVLEGCVDEVARRRRSEGLIASIHDDLPFERRIAAVYADGGFVMREWRRFLRCKEYYDLVTSDGVLDAVSRVIGPEVTYQGNSHLRPHLPGLLDRLPWHQDGVFYGPGIEAMQPYLVQAWLPLTTATLDGGCMAVVPGSHRWGPIPLPDGSPITPRTDPEAVYAAVAERVGMETTVLLPMRPGDLLVFRNMLAHTGTENRSDRVRWSIDMRFEVTGGSVALTADEEAAYEIARRRQRSRAAVPLRVRGVAGPESWDSWKAGLSASAAS